MALEFSKSDSKSGAGFGDWFERHQAQQDQSTDESKGCENNQQNAWLRLKSNIFTSWNEYEQQDGLLPTFVKRSETPGFSYTQRFRGFVVSLLVSVAFFALAFFVGLPTVVIRPHKFALCFTIGSLCFLWSFILLKGPSEQFKSIFKTERLPFSVLYLFTMLGTLYSCLVLKSYILVIVFSSLQIISLLWFFIAMVPGGSNGIKYFLTAISKTVRYTVLPCLQGIVRGTVS
mmetsp:Transcript_7450/g.10437  ORF Transcript_7450/g.10437 Transcript_7450/m.10437 type:complete len:231 (-) Transcript_7450:51-743(-)